MSDATAEVVAAPRAELAEPAERGSLEVADRVFRKIAARAAAEVDHTAELPTRLTDRLPGRETRPARADVVRNGRLVQLRVDIAVAYPTPIVGVTRAVRARVGEVVGRLCDVEVRDVDVVVSRLSRPSERRRVL